MATLSHKEFKKLYPNDGVCLTKLFQLRFGHLTHCPECNSDANFRRVRTRKCFHCCHCYKQFHPMEGTFFQDTKIPLTDWFYVMHLFTTTRNGVAAKEIERALGVTYKTAFRMGHRIRMLMEGDSPEKLKGFIECDETFYRSGKKDADGQHPDESIVFGMVERTGKVKAFKVGNIQRETLYPIIARHIEKKAHVSTDEASMYAAMNNDFDLTHGSVNHTNKQYKKNWITTNTIEGYFSQIKRAIHGTHLHVSDRYFENYMNECTFRYNNRKCQEMMFEVMLKNVGRKEL
jgi:transposase